jgi:hypothetical protein
MTPDGYSETINEIAFPDRIRLLPLKVQDEIADYVDFLFSKYSGKDAPKTPAQKPSITRLRGTLNNANISDIRDETDRTI